MAVATNRAGEGPRRPTRRWRFYRTAAGREPVRDFLLDRHLPDEDAAALAAVMIEVRRSGREHPDVNQLKGDIWQIEIGGRTAAYRLLFAEEGRSHQILLALEVVNKKWQKAKARHIQLAEARLAEWRQRGREKRLGTARTPSPE